MIAWIPFILCVVVAMTGSVFRYRLSEPAPFHREVAVLGAYSLGLLVVWLPATLLRGLLIGTYANSVTILEGLAWAVPIFFAESLILVAALGRQLFYLKGDYDAQSEWIPTIYDGVRLIGRILSISLILFFLCWWLISPGEYGTYRGSIGDHLVLDNVEAILRKETKGLSIESVENQQTTMAIPAAMAIANVLAICSFLIVPTFRYMQRELNSNYVYETEIPANRQRFGPRGGGRN